MPQQASSCSSNKTNAQATTDARGVSQASRPGSKNLPEERAIDSCGAESNPCKTLQEGKPELSDFNWASSPGTEEWQIGQTADGRAVYSTISGVGAGVMVEFQKWDW